MESKIEWGLLGGRITLGIIMLAHGIQKLGGMENTIAMFEKIGQPAWLAYATAIIEALGGAFLILGIFVVPSAILLGLTMMGAIVLVKFRMGLIGGYEFPLSLLGLSFILAFTGSRKLAISGVLLNKNKEIDQHG
ncbi:DoxX family protein [Bacillus sp. NTK071]|uniref:DoxX family protein n=1 Tax=Guptibacillus hwajinpoensis TaxID=208199 RepID=A0A4U1MBR7_9BACL|nr:DoxX family protein [Pseudalkalibacillus hwajinpoensis]MBN8210868.1 DoxX family protein [Bacillus sp. NTK071]TKD67486.1 DoxX family protein [Pseudalkalibacillus hwajinpoensis]